MSIETPTGWELTTLESVADFLDSQREPINSSEREIRIKGKPITELFAYYGATGQVGWIDAFRSEGESVLLGEDGAPFLDPNKDKAYLVTGRYWVNNHAHILRGFNECLSTRFLCYQLNTVDYSGLVTGTTRLKLTSSAMKQIPFLLAPYNEQIRIVEKLEELFSDLDAGVAELKAAQKKLAQYRQSLLKAAMEGSLTAEWRTKNKPKETGAHLMERILKERRGRWEEKQLARFKKQGKTPPKGWQDKYPEPVKPDTTSLPELPEGWVWASVDQLTIEQKYGSSSKTTEDSSGVPILRMGNIQDGQLDFTSLKYLPTDHDEFPELYLKDGDLLFNRTNSPELVGKTAVYRSQIIPCSFASYLISVRFSERYIPELASTYINSLYGRYWVKSVAVQQVGQANVNGSKLSALAVPLPPLEEQTIIISGLQAQLDQATEQSSNIDKSLKQAAAQRKNILKSAFSGLLVPQDPYDEPASLLLERIREERKASIKISKKTVTPRRKPSC